MKGKSLFILFVFLLTIVSCSSVRYDSLINQVMEYNWFFDMKDAEKALNLLERAIVIAPDKWNAYSLEISIYESWNQKTENNTDRQDLVKTVYERWGENNNTFTSIQKFCYANTLYSLNEKQEAYSLYTELFKFFSNQKELLENSELNYCTYIFSGVMLEIISKDNFSDYKLSYYAQTDGDSISVNDYILQELEEINTDDDRKKYARNNCTC